MNAKILIVDDEEKLRLSLSQLLTMEGYEVATASSGKEALSLLSENKPSSVLPNLILLDVRLPDSDGLNLLKQIKETNREISIIMITGYGSVRQSVEAMQLGACDYILKPFHADEILLRVKKLLETQKLKERVEYLSEQVLGPLDEEFVHGPNAAMRSLLHTIDQLSISAVTPVLICGETGTGKELIAKRIHKKSQRKRAPFVAINVSALSQELLESELFGHEAGAFTGAVKTKKGLFEVASGGTLFLDEIGDMEISLQAKLLRALQEQKIRRVGGINELPINVRFLAATNKDLLKAIDSGGFRKDLYYRLNVIQLSVPPLRERKEEIELLANYFMKLFNTEFKKEVKKLSLEALNTLQNYSWPGNIRELRNVMERSMLLGGAREVLDVEQLLLHTGAVTTDPSTHSEVIGDNIPLEFVEREHIQAVLSANNGNKNLAAQILGIDRTTLYNKLKKYQEVHRAK